MKTITQRLNEVMLLESNDVIKVLQTTKFTFTPYDVDYNKEVMTSNAKKQEEEIIKTLKEHLPNAKVYSSIKYAKLQNTSWTPYYDLLNGDIVIESGNETYFIDMKAGSKSSSDTILGPINANSLMNFANKKNHYYLVFNNTGSIKLLIDGQKLYKTFMKDPVLLISKNRDNTINLNAEVREYKGSPKTDGKVYAADFISTGWINYHKRDILA
jgi:hypothetical protein